MAITLAKAQQKLALWEAAYDALSSGVKSYTISTGGSTRVVTRQDLKTVREEFFYWQSKVDELEIGRKGMPIRFGTPIR